MSQIHSNFGNLPLMALRAFEAAARLGSFREGAAEVGLTPSAVSHHVRQLETALGVPLFERLHRNVVLTPAGMALATSLGEGLTIIAGAYAAAQAPRGRLSVSATPSFAVRWLLPLSGPLREEGIDLQVEGTATAANVESGASHVAIRLAPRPPTRLVSTCLVTSPVVLVVSPRRLAGRTKLDLEEISAGPLIGLTSGPSFWPEALASLGAPPRPNVEARFDSFDTALAAAEAGFGIAYAPEILVADRFAQGVLSAAHPRRLGRRRAWSYWFVTRPEIAESRPVRRLLVLLQTALAQSG